MKTKAARASIEFGAAGRCSHLRSATRPYVTSTYDVHGHIAPILLLDKIPLFLSPICFGDFLPLPVCYFIYERPLPYGALASAAAAIDVRK